MINYAYRKIKISLCIFLLIFISSCRKYDGDGKFIDNGLFSSSHRYQIYFEEVNLDIGINTYEYEFSGMPGSTFGLYFKIRLNCDYYDCENIDSREGIINDLLKDSELKIGVNILESGSEYIAIEESYLSPPYGYRRLWQYSHRGGIELTYLHSEMSIGMLKFSSQPSYNIQVLVEANENISRKVYIQPFMLGGMAWAM